MPLSVGNKAAPGFNTWPVQLSADLWARRALILYILNCAFFTLIVLMMRAPLIVLLQIVRNNWCKPLQPRLKGPCQPQHNNRAVCVRVYLCVLHPLPQGGSRRKVTHHASPAYKCRRLLAEVPLVLRHDSLVHFFPPNVQPFPRSQLASSSDLY